MRRMRVIILSLMIAAGMTAAARAQEQPARLEVPALLGEAAPAPVAAAPDTPSPVTLPDLSPDVLNAPVRTYEAPAGITPDTKSVISPAMEPWQKEKKKRWKGKTADEVFLTLPYDVQSQILDETYKVNAECNNYKIYSQFHNCECMGSHYFEERVFNPEISKDTLVGRISGECASIPGVAGYGYDQCLASMRFLLIKSRVGDYCTCFANTLAENYKISPSPDFSHLRALSSKTNTQCLAKFPASLKALNPEYNP